MGGRHVRCRPGGFDQKYLPAALPVSPRMPERGTMILNCKVFRAGEKEYDIPMMIELNDNERELLVHQIEVMILPELRCQIGSGVRKELRDEMKHEKVVLTQILEKLKGAA